MIKVSECQLCGNYFRTGKIRQILNKWIGDFTEAKPKLIESKMLVCKGCYQRILKGEGIASKGGSNPFWDTAQGDERDLAMPTDWGKDAVIKPPEVKPERKKRGRKPKADAVSIEAKPDEVKEPVEQNPEHEALKDRVRQILVENGDILYGEIATRLGIDENDVASICDEIDKEKGV